MARTPPRREKLLAATTNRGKLREITGILEGLAVDILMLEDLGLSLSAPEEGRTFMENARQKGLFYSRRTPILTLAEDSGLEVDYLDGAPGVFSARFSGPEADDAHNVAKVLDLLRGVPEKKRTARFVCCAVLCRNGSVLNEITGRAAGRISLEPRGRGGFGYDPIFIYPPLGRTFAELSPSEKSAVSHRGQALRKVREYLARLIASHG
ncbi:MAG: non-canonical purine NTP pyrophosphatase, RdgB/HAM1 family [Candidatus Aminicenantes bacterium RBG_13_62_12]|nr:MAG: non-canonical purine NTP pyrophosphatase, RdgB/HAM1 family [Candidatus Aminicenantes bacterium RBG_13_62_12]OGD36661.1 MAG: non-canonical purine NTP pyrophosphatase, RdgB/HAM1 family [Candidatus Aminicenantes bacterium RBG_19FT_COMBO_58_17]